MDGSGFSSVMVQTEQQQRWIGAGKMTKPCLEEETRLCHLREVGNPEEDPADLQNRQYRDNKRQ